jgi:hypothetical protein
MATNEVAWNNASIKRCVAGIASNQIGGVNGVDQDLLILRFPERPKRERRFLQRRFLGALTPTARSEVGRALSPTLFHDRVASECQRVLTSSTSSMTAGPWLVVFVSAVRLHFFATASLD